MATVTRKGEKVPRGEASRNRTEAWSRVDDHGAWRGGDEPADRKRGGLIQTIRAVGYYYGVEK